MSQSTKFQTALKTVAALVALIAALATTGCTASTVMGPAGGNEAQANSVASPTGATSNEAGGSMNRVKPERITPTGD